MGGPGARCGASPVSEVHRARGVTRGSETSQYPQEWIFRE